MSDWQPIDTAPKDGRPVWARGWDYGHEGTFRHAGWVYFVNTGWQWAGAEHSYATHLTDWLPT